MKAQKIRGGNGRQEEPLAYTVAQLRQRLGPGVCGRSSLYQALQRGDLRSVRVGKKIIVPAEAVREWLAGGTQPAEGEPR